MRLKVEGEKGNGYRNHMRVTINSVPCGGGEGRSPTAIMSLAVLDGAGMAGSYDD
jgi:hypothetical protein